jgi:hypothetical protein
MTVFKDEDWLQVPSKVRKLYLKHAGTAHRLRREYPDADSWVIADDEVGDLVIKRANFLKPVGDVHSGLQKALGGPNPLAAALVSGALTGGLGYGAGWLAEKLLPERYVEQGEFRKRLALLAGLGGALPTLYYKAQHNVPEYGPKGFLLPGPDNGGENFWTQTGILKQPQKSVSHFQSVSPPTKGQFHIQQDYDKLPGPLGKTITASDKYAAAIKLAEDRYNLVYTMDKVAAHAASSAGAVFSNDLSKDAWGATVIADPFLTAQQKAVAIGPFEAASMRKGSRWLSVADVVHGALGAGWGAGLGKGLGLIAKTVLPMKPEAVKDIQRAGLFAGAIKGVMPGIFS